MTDRTRKMNQSATYWAPGGPDGFGGIVYSDSEVISCRWQDKAELFRDTQAREVTSSAVVYPEHVLEIGGLLVLGDFYENTDPKAVGAREIRQIGKSPNLRANQDLHKVWL